MANRLSMAVIQSIEALRKSGKSLREIARLLGVHRETVGKYVSRLENRPNAPPGSECGSGADSAAATSLPPAHSPGPASACEPYRELILGKLERGLSAQRIHQDLVHEQGFTARYHSVRRFVAKLLQRTELPVRRLEVEPGSEAQVDFGTAAPVRTADGKVRKPWVFRIVLSGSRKAYSEAVFHQCHWAR